MKTRIWLIVAAAVLVAAKASAQSILFDFDNLAATTPLPVTDTVSGITAHISSSGLGGYSIQAANTMGFTPTNFSGNCIYPSGIDAADLVVSFSQPLNSFSILYAPHELACDSSATMRVTAYLDGALVGTATTNATALCTCTWQSQTLAFGSASGFNSVVVHYDAAPPGCQDYGTIFMADNMMVVPVPTPVVLTGPAMLPGGGFQFSFTNLPGGTNTVFATTNLLWLLTNWSILGIASEMLPGQFQFTDNQATNEARFYRVRSE